MKDTRKVSEVRARVITLLTTGDSDVSTAALDEGTVGHIWYWHFHVLLPQIPPTRIRAVAVSYALAASLSVLRCMERGAIDELRAQAHDRLFTNRLRRVA